MHRLFASAAASLAILAGDLASISSRASAGEPVHFNSAVTPPTPFQIERARAKGIELHPRPGIPLTGLLTRPDGDGPFPAVILLHGCQGIRPYQTAWAARLAEWGYVALQIDSHGPRGLPSDTCGRIDQDRTAGDQVFDVFGAVEFLRALPFVDADRTAVMGWAHGGRAALDLSQPDSLRQFFGQDVRAAIGLYPDCGRDVNDRTRMPVLVLNGSEDDRSLASRCRAMADGIARAGGGLDLVVLDGALHGFDDPAVGERTFFPKEMNRHKNPSIGVTRGHDAAAGERAQQEIRGFLARHLAE